MSISSEFVVGGVGSSVRGVVSFWCEARYGVVGVLAQFSLGFVK